MTVLRFELSLSRRSFVLVEGWKYVFEINKYSSTDPQTAKLAVGALIGAGMFVVCMVAGGVMIMMPFTPPNWPLTRTEFSEIVVFIS